MRSRLQGKMIKVIVLSLVVVSSLFILIVTIFNYLHIAREADRVLLDYMVIIEGRGPVTGAPPLPPEERTRMGFILPFNLRDVIHLCFSDGGNIIEEIYYTNDQALVSQAISASEKILNGSREKGYSALFRYMKIESPDATDIYLVDARKSFSNYVFFTHFMILVNILVAIAVLALACIFSSRLIAPIVKGYEKQRRFITDAGHELRTPLTIIDADCEALEIEKGENEWTHDIRKQVKRLSSLTFDLIFLSKLEEDDKKNMIELPFSDIVKDAALSFQNVARMEKKDIVLLSDDMVEVYGDGVMLERLVYILLDNAVKHSTDDSRITVRLSDTGKYACLAVSNFTDEKNLENLGLIFERFYKADDSRSSEKKGFGIGLAIARAVVEKHEGRIAARSENSNEMTLEVLLPKKKERKRRQA